MAYKALSSHQPREGAVARPSPANSYGPPGWGRSVRPGAKPRLVSSRSPSAVHAAVGNAVSSAFPAPRVRAMGPAAGAAVAELIDEKLAEINDAVEQANEWLIGETQAASQSLHPGLNYIGELKGPEWMVGTGPLQAPASKPFVWNGLGGLGVTYLSSGTNPNTYKSYGWGGATAAVAVNPLQYLGLFPEPLTWRYKSAQRRYQRSIQVYRNVSGSVIPNWLVDVQPEYGPLVNPRPAPKTRLKEKAQIVVKPPRMVDEVYIDITPVTVIVSVKPPQRPPAGVRERKGSGKSGAASAVFWAYEMASDVADWIDIVTAAHTTMPHSVRRGSRAERLAWMARNPDTLITDVDWPAVGAAMVGWLIDEKIGAAMGRLQQRAHASFGGPIQSKYGAGSRPSGVDIPGLGSVGSEVSAFVRSLI